MELIDISPEISNSTAVFPGDVKFSRDVSMAFSHGNHLELSSITSTLHLGAHADAPIHYHKDGKGIDSVNLKHYVGNCQVISATNSQGKRLTLSDFSNLKISAKRILIKTKSYPNPNRWNSDFTSLSKELVHHFHKNGVITIGIDTPSVDPEGDKLLESHKALFQCQMANLEGLVLDKVEDGNYFLVAPPLKLKDAEASPVRALLIKGDLNFD